MPKHRRFSDATFIPAGSAQTDRADRAVHATDLRPPSNELLDALPRKDFQLLASKLVSVNLAQGAVHFEPAM
jgi:hypothetical protein